MKAGLIHAMLLIIVMGAMGCGAVPEPPVPCTQEEFTLHHGVYSLEYCEALGMECNEAVTLAEVCPGFAAELEQYIREVLLPMISDRLSFLPSFIDVEELVSMLFDQYVGVCGEVDFLGDVGTCQPLGSVQAPCAEDADCNLEFLCDQGVCVEPQNGTCVEDEECPVDLVCTEGTCSEAPPPA